VATPLYLLNYFCRSAAILVATHVMEEEMHVSLVTLSFQRHALKWWNSLVPQRRRKGLHDIDYWFDDIDYWFDHKEAFHARHVPSYYKRELMDKFQRLQQRSMTV